MHHGLRGGWTPLLDKGLPVQLNLGLILTRQGPDNDVAYHGTCEDQLRNPKTAEVCFSISHAGCYSPSSTKFDPQPNRLLQCRFCRLATTQHHSASGSHQRYCSSLVLRVEKFDHISTLMRDELQRLRIGERTRFKLSILVHKCLNNSTPPYFGRQDQTTIN